MVERIYLSKIILGFMYLSTFLERDESLFSYFQSLPYHLNIRLIRIKIKGNN